MDYSISSFEGEQEEWKEVFSEVLFEEAMQTLCAFLNSAGGKVIFGVNAKGKPAGLVCDLDKAQRDIFDRTRTYLKPSAAPFFRVRVQENRIYIFVSPDPRHIYQYRGIIYKRTGTSTHVLTFDEAKALESQRNSGFRELSPGVFSRGPQGEVLKCTNPNCGYTEISGSSTTIVLGDLPTESKCPHCGSALSSEFGLYPPCSE